MFSFKPGGQVVQLTPFALFIEPGQIVKKGSRYPLGEQIMEVKAIREIRVIPNGPVIVKGKGVIIEEG